MDSILDWIFDRIGSAPDEGPVWKGVLWILNSIFWLLVLMPFLAIIWVQRKISPPSDSEAPQMKYFCATHLFRDSDQEPVASGPLRVCLTLAVEHAQVIRSSFEKIFCCDKHVITCQAIGCSAPAVAKTSQAVFVCDDHTRDLPNGGKCWIDDCEDPPIANVSGYEFCFMHLPICGVEGCGSRAVLWHPRRKDWLCHIHRPR